ncbi:MAG: phosphatidylglycerol:prolipoprotein diacylglycerol transferase [Kiritimatiellia bacterium]
MPVLHPWWPDGSPLWLHPHLLFELLSYVVGIVILAFMRRGGGDRVASFEHRVILSVGMLAGATLGAKSLYLLTDPVATWEHLNDLQWLLGGKTIAGALLGGIGAVEVTKLFLGIRHSTGDVLIPGLTVGIAVGRLGCFFTGISDGTHGVVTAVPWAMNLGDGLMRHPTAAYEVVALLILGATTMSLRPHLRNGDAFALWAAGYLAWRVAVESIKTQPFWVSGLSAIQAACLIGLLYYAIVAVLRLRGSTMES